VGNTRPPVTVTSFPAKYCDRWPETLLPVTAVTPSVPSRRLRRACQCAGAPSPVCGPFPHINQLCLLAFPDLIKEAEQGKVAK